MKLRRAMAVAAATAVIAPVAFLSAPAAFATDGDQGTTQTSTTDPADTPDGGPTDQAPPAGDSDETPPAPPATDPTTLPTDDPATDPTADPTDDPTTDPTGDPTGDPTTDPTGDPTTDPTGEPTGEPTTDPTAPPTGDPTTEPTAPPTTEPPTDEPTDPVDECDAADFHTSLSGLPSRIVAGSGWKKFNLNLDNSKGRHRENLILGATLLYKKDLQGSFESDLTTKFASIEYYNPDSKVWTSELSDGGSIAGSLAVDKGDKVALQLRVKISSKAPAGAAVAIAFGVYGDDENCVADEMWYTFDVLAAGSNPGDDVPDAKPQGGKNPAPVSDLKPQGDVKDIPVTGNLAETGSSSATPVIGIVGGIAIVAGAGVVFAMKRRRSGATA